MEVATLLTYIAKSAHGVDREEDVEIVVADWGSVIPLSSVVKLSAEAAKISSFLAIPPGIAQYFQKDSPFSEVHVLNAVARRAKWGVHGENRSRYICGRTFFKTFSELYEGKCQLGIALNSALLLANLRMVPYRFSFRCPSSSTVIKLIRWFGRFLKIETSSGKTFYSLGVGIWLGHRSLWNDCGGYNVN